MTKQEKAAYGKTYYAKHKVRIAKQQVARKAEKAAYDKVYQETNRDEIAAKKKVYRQNRKAELDAYQRDWYAENKDERAKYNKKYRAANKARIAEHNKTWVKANPDKRAEYRKAWQQANPDKVCDSATRRRARKRGAFVENVERSVVYKRDGGRCHLCGKKVPKNRWHLDHIIPLERGMAHGGEHSYRNVAVACTNCNLRKGTKARGQPRLF